MAQSLVRMSGRSTLVATGEYLLQDDQWLSEEIFSNDVLSGVKGSNAG